MSSICFHVALIIVVLFVARGDSLTCYKCTSEKSFDDCNSKQTEVTCPSGTTQCLAGTLSCTAGDVTNKVYVKRCSIPNSDDCETSRDDSPSCPSSSMSWSVSTSSSCCSGNNCNSVNSGTSHSVNRVMLVACFALILWALAR